MFAPSRPDLDAARLAFKDMHHPIQLAVMVSMGRVWAQDVEPERGDNPFLFTS